MKEEEEGKEPNSLVAIETSLRRAPELIITLISTSYSTMSFPLKWKAIRAKLEQLNSGLVAATGADDDSAENSALTELLQSIVSSVSDTQVLASQCSDGSYVGGKLQLRSDLDVAAAKIELSLERLTEIYASGLLTPSRAIVLSRLGSGASCEEMRFYVKDLRSRVMIGNQQMRVRALAALNEVFREDEKYVRIVAVEIVDGINLISSLLELKNIGIQEEATEAIVVISGFNSYRGALVMAGVIAPLIRVLDMGNESSKERAARALQRLTENSNNSWSVSAHDGVDVLLKICGDGSSSAELIALACGILRNLSGVPEIKSFMVEEGLLPVLLKLLRSREVVQTQAIGFLHRLASGDEAIKQRLVREGIIESLVVMLDPDSFYSSKGREIALRATEGFCFSSLNSINILLGSGFISRLF